LIHVFILEEKKRTQENRKKRETIGAKEASAPYNLFSSVEKRLRTVFGDKSWEIQ